MKPVELQCLIITVLRVHRYRLDRLLADKFGKANVVRDGNRLMRITLDDASGTVALPSLVR